MFFDDHKKIVTLIMSKRSPQGEVLMSPTAMKAESVKTEAGEPDGLHAACQDILGAIQAHSADQLREGLCNFLEIYEAQEHSFSEEEEEHE